MRFTFKNGIHPSANKELSRNIALCDFPAPKKLYISMSQHLGAPALPTVKVGDGVKVGTLIGRASGFMSANVYSSVSGKVLSFIKRPTPQGNNLIHIEIENDEAYSTELLPPLNTLDKESILGRIAQAGIVGMGGATFPTHIKLKPPKCVDALIINGAECEPYITCDYRLMVEKTAEILEGIKLIMQTLEVKQAFIGIESNKAEAIAAFNDIVPENIKVIKLETKYPQGAEKQLIYAITRRRVNAGGLPMDVGCVVDNVHTAYSIYRAVIHNEPCYMRAMTISGRGISKSANVWIRTGITYQDIYNELSDTTEKKYTKAISGGPMMGFAQPNLSASVGKGSSALLFLNDKEINIKGILECINCSRCHKVCPMNLMPMMFDRLTYKCDIDMIKQFSVNSCIECGSCTYVCPAGRPLIQSIRLGKKIIRERNR